MHLTDPHHEAYVDLAETLHAVRLAADLFERAMGYSAAERVTRTHAEIAHAASLIEDALEDLYQEVGAACSEAFDALLPPSSPPPGKEPKHG